MSVFAGRLSQVVKLSPPLQPLYEGWFLALFNLLYSTLPVLYIGLFEQVSARRVSAFLSLPALCLMGINLGEEQWD